MWKSTATNPAVVAPLAAIGGAWIASQLYNVASFAYFHFLRGSSLDRYKRPGAWALITGASDGLGKGFAQELCHRGFNVVIHGRNEQKLNKVRDDLLKQNPDRQVRVLVLDAGVPFDIARLEAAVQQVKDIDLRLLINNVGGATRPWFIPLSEQTTDVVREWIDLNARFHPEITRLLLPQLTKDKSFPAAVVNIGSVAATAASPYLGVYSGTKAFVRVWSESMDVEMKSEGHNVQFYCIVVGEVDSNSTPRPVTMMVPSSRTFASSTLDKIGGGRRYTAGYWSHAFALGIFSVMPLSVLDSMILDVIGPMKVEEEKAAGKDVKTPKSGRSG